MAFQTDYYQNYPGLENLENGYETVRRECVALLEIKDEITDISALGGSYTQGGIHTAKWKSFMFMQGSFIEQNCERCPETTNLLQQIPGLYTAFFSILDPNQYIPPHWGYYRGFVRYHLGVLIPQNNAKEDCWLRINTDREENAREDGSLVRNGEVYYWKNGQGVIFDDTHLHDAKNGSDEIRVVLWLDLRKKLPFFFDALNRLVLHIAHRDPSLEKLREAAKIAPKAG